MGFFFVAKITSFVAEAMILCQTWWQLKWLSFRTYVQQRMCVREANAASSMVWRICDAMEFTS